MSEAAHIRAWGLVVSRGIDRLRPSTAIAGLISNHAELEGVWVWINDAPADEKPIAKIRSDMLHLERLGVQTRLTLRYDNWGFTGAYNRMLRAAAEHRPSTHCLILNPDVLLSAQAIRALLYGAGQDSRALLGLPLQRLDPVTLKSEGVIDSLGIGWTKSGRHYDVAAGESVANLRAARSVRIRGITGALCFLTADLLKDLMSRDYEVFDDLFFAYREDAELGLRLFRYGVVMKVLDGPVNGHIRTLRGYQRGAYPLIDLLGVRNRSLLRYKYGNRRFGAALATRLRDLVVLLAVASTERSSWRGVRDARRIRRYARYKGRQVEAR